jgi:hypothetical protein
VAPTPESKYTGAVLKFITLISDPSAIVALASEGKVTEALLAALSGTICCAKVASIVRLCV